MCKALAASLNGRHSMAAAMYGRAAAHGDALVAAHLQLKQAQELELQVNSSSADEADERAAEAGQQGDGCRGEEKEKIYQLYFRK